jgi:hypothetical protein
MDLHWRAVLPAELTMIPHSVPSTVGAYFMLSEIFVTKPICRTSSSMRASSTSTSGVLEGRQLPPSWP